MKIAAYCPFYRDYVSKAPFNLVWKPFNLV